MASIAATIARLMAHYWTANETSLVRREQTEDWLDDLAEFPPGIVAEACRQWRRISPRRPTPADIRILCSAEQRERQEHHTAIADNRTAWPAWLEELWGPPPEGPQKRAEATARIKRLLGEPAE